MALERTALNWLTRLNKALERPHDSAIVQSYSVFVALGALFSAILNDIFYHGENREETTFSCWCLLDLSFCGDSFR